MALLLTTLTAAGPVWVVRNWQAKRAVSTVMGVSAMFMGGLLVHFGQGPVQSELRFYIFVLLAMLVVYANPMVIVAAAATATLHHALLWAVLPASIFNYDASFGAVAVHSAFVILESVAACLIARSFFNIVIGLEKTVALWTAESADSSKNLKRVLDSMEQGFLTVDAKGRMSEERSTALQSLMGMTPSSGLFVDLVRNFNPDAADEIGTGLEDVFADIMPIETTIDQLPSRLIANRRTLEISYSPVYEVEQLTNLAVVVSDITAVVEREEMEAENREMMVIIDGITKDKVGFIEFMDEAESLVVALREKSREDLVLLKRRIHTLKSTTATFGLNRVSEACHEIEKEIEESSECPEGRLWTELFGCWASARGKLRRLLANETKCITVDDQEFTTVLQAVLDGHSKDNLAVRLASWNLEQTKERLVRVKDQARQLAAKLGKGKVQVVTKDHGLKTETAAWSSFWSSLAHVVRNAVDHGLETPKDRKAQGKTSNGLLTVQTFIDDDQFVISIADDGRGINWENVRTAAEERGLPSSSQTDLLEALFADGVSTETEVTATSGRGVGMAAVRSECESLGGMIQVRTAPGEGTELRFCFPTETMAPSTHQLLSDHAVVKPERATSAVACSL